MPEFEEHSSPCKCPHCGAKLPQPPQPNEEMICTTCGVSIIQEIAGAEFDPGFHELDGLDIAFIQSARETIQTPGWQRRITADLLDLANQELKRYCEQLPEPRHGGGFWHRRKRWKKELDDCFEGILMAINGFQGILRTDIQACLKAEHLAPLRSFHDRMVDEVLHLQRFTGEAARLAFPAHSDFTELQRLLMSWASIVSEEIEDFATNLRQSGMCSPAPTAPQITLTPPTMSRFYQVYEGLH